MSTGGSFGWTAGAWVEVRSKEEILRTLDGHGCLDALPFMPEMFQYCGLRLRIYRSAHKTCDTINFTGGRRMQDAVHLENVRCDGQGHGSCQAACLVFWKKVWLKPVDAPGTDHQARSGRAAPPASGCGEEDVVRSARSARSEDGEGDTYVCQATELLRATTPLRSRALGQYVDDYRSGNVGARTMVDGLAHILFAKLVRRVKGPDSRAGRWLVAAYDRVQAARGGRPFPRKVGKIPPGTPTPTASLGLKAGEWVRVKPYDEILKTLDGKNKNRGLYFDAEHVPFCGDRFRVRTPVEQIIDEKTGKMLHLKSTSVILDGAWCQSGYSEGRLFCPRAIFPYWREIWLERAEEDQATAERPQLVALRRKTRASQ